jgi:hypothetical protein
MPLWPPSGGRAGSSESSNAPAARHLAFCRKDAIREGWNDTAVHMEQKGRSAGALLPLSISLLYMVIETQTAAD